MKTNPIALSAFAATLACAPLAAFEKIALIDSFDFGTHFDTETVAGTEQILDHVLLTGADTVLWRNCGGATMRYRSQEEPPLLMEAPLDPRRVPESRPVHGWLRYWAVEPDIVRTAFASCKRRGVARGIHWPYEENQTTGATGRSARGTSRIRSSGAATRAAFRGTDAARSPSPRWWRTNSASLTSFSTANPRRSSSTSSAAAAGRWPTNT